MNIAVFFDAENISAQFVPGILAELKKLGGIPIQYAYADWSLSNTKPWKNLMQDYPIKAMQQFQNGEKQVTDKQIMMDAVEIACTKKDIDTFAIVSSDKGFTALAIKLKELGKQVIGIGEKKSPAIWTNVCNQFLFVEHKVMVPESEPAPLTKDQTLAILKEAYGQYDNGNPEGILLSTLKAKINKLHPDFTYDKRKFPMFHHLCEAFPDDFDVLLDFGKSRIKAKYPMKKMEGTITSAKGLYSFATGTDGNVYFIDSAEILPPHHTLVLKEGMKVRFSIAKTPDPNGKSTKARNGVAAQVAVLI